MSNSSYLQTAAYAAAAGAGAYGAAKAGKKAAAAKTGKKAASMAAAAKRRTAEKAKSVGRAAVKEKVAAAKSRELGGSSPTTKSGNAKSYGERGLSKSQRATLDKARSANADKVTSRSVAKGMAKSGARTASRFAGPVGAAILAKDFYEAGRRGAGTSTNLAESSHSYGKGGPQNYWADGPQKKRGGPNKAAIKRNAKAWLPEKAKGKEISTYDQGKPVYRRKDSSAKVQDSKEMREYRNKRRLTGSYKGNYYGPDQFKGDSERLKDWRKAGSPKDIDGWLKTQGTKKLDNKWVKDNG